MSFEASDEDLHLDYSESQTNTAAIDVSDELQRMLYVIVCPLDLTWCKTREIYDIIGKIFSGHSEKSFAVILMQKFIGGLDSKLQAKVKYKEFKDFNELVAATRVYALRLEASSYPANASYRKQVSFQTPTVNKYNNGRPPPPRFPNNRDCILGWDAIQKHAFKLDGKTKSIFLAKDGQGSSSVFRVPAMEVTTVRKTTLSHQTSLVIVGQLKGSFPYVSPNTAFIFTSVEKFPARVYIEEFIGKVSGDGTYNIAVENHSLNQVKIPRNTKLGVIEIIHRVIGKIALDEREAKPNEITEPIVVSEVDTEFQAPLSKLLNDFHDLFASKDSKLGNTNLIKHTIDTQGRGPIRPYRVTNNQRKLLEDKVQEMLQANVIRYTQSPWASPVFIKRSVNYLGHDISTDGIKPDPGKIDKLVKYKVPTAVDESADMSRPSSPTPSETPSETEAREEALRSRDRRDVLELFDERAMDSEEDPRFAAFEYFHGLDDDSSSRRESRLRGRSPSQNVVSRQQSHRLRRWLVEGLAKDVVKSLRESFKLKFEGSFELQCPKVDESMVRHLKNAKRDRSGNRKVVEYVEKAWLSSQYQVMDAMRPLIHIWINLPDTSPLMEAEESAFQLLGGAFANISKMRRLNVMRQVAPKMSPLLDDPRVFSSREISRLFGNKFLDAMVKKVEDENKLAKIGRAGGLYDRSWSTGNNVGTTQEFFAVATADILPVGIVITFFRVKVRVTINNQGASGPDPAVGARLLSFSEIWSSFTADSWVLDVVSRGYLIEFDAVPVQLSFPSDSVMSAEMTQICDQELSDLLLKKAIVPISCSTDGFVSNMFAVPKSSGGWRPILNLKKLNSFVRYEHFKMEGMESIKYLICKNDWLVKVDLRDAYFTVPLAAKHQKFVRLLWNASSADLDSQHLHVVVDFVTSLGSLVNTMKSIFIPTQEIEFLGVIVNSISLSFSLPPEKVAKVTQMCEKAFRADKISLRQLASILGNFSFEIPAVAFAPAHYRNLQRLYISESRGAKSNLNHLVSLSATARSDLVWWVDNLESSNDRESRTSIDLSDWMIDSHVFHKIRSLWEVQIDLFANAWNAQLSTFVSWVPQPLALTTNAFSLCWKRQKCYAFPPFALIPRCLANVRKEEASLVLVCPFWPSQTWFPLLLELTKDVPRIIRPQPDLLLSSDRAKHPLNESLILSVWRISGCVSEIEHFQKRLSLYCWTPTVLPRFLLTSPPGTIGLAGVLNGDPIPCVTLSMLSMTLDSLGGFKIGDHPLVVQLLKGCFNNNPPRPRYDSTWDPDDVFRYLTTTLMRVSELASISFQSLSFSETAASVTLLRLRKTQRSGALQSFSLPVFPDSSCGPKTNVAIRNYLEKGELNEENSQSKPEWAKEIKYFEIIEGTLYRHEVPSKNSKRNEINCQVVLPLSLRHLVLKELHDAPIGGHLAFYKTYLKVKNHYYWPTMRKDILEYCQACETCIANTSSTCRVLLHPHEIAKALFQVIGMDFVGPITPASPNGNSYI
ncbi:Uncharacterized protein APZ42_025183 [Daphnia magna]|uniref:Integrase zinc-binding domain-containing protein n=1 Tax=Daphnia magna TaxID=35525 RepID=A0A164TCU1_9CRUS|nr:Uncharacterized protein APZ42_025183 [Daphnia magna]